MVYPDATGIAARRITHPTLGISQSAIEEQQIIDTIGETHSVLFSDISLIFQIQTKIETENWASYFWRYSPIEEIDPEFEKFGKICSMEELREWGEYIHIPVATDAIEDVK